MGSSRLAVWLQASRPKTLWAALAPVLIGTAMAIADDAFHALSAIAALAVGFLMQIGTNFSNDLADFKKGADTSSRVGPQRVTQAGLVTPRQMSLATALVFGVALIVCGYLMTRGGWPIFVVAMLSILAGLGYTAGPMPYGYLGLGELFVLIFFGPVAVACTYYVQTLTINGTVVLAGLGPGLLAVAILVVNNLRDVSGDAKAGKKTLAVRFGRRFARREYVFCILGAVGVPVLLFYLQRGDHPVVLLAVLTLPLIRPTMIKVCSSDSPADLNLALGHTARALLVYAILFAIGWVWS